MLYFYTGDDCIAIIGESSYINATGIACGPGHGIRFIYYQPYLKITNKKKM